MDGNNYSIVKLNSIKTFLLKNDTIITDQTEFDSTLYSYYMQLYYPTEAEIDELMDAITTFNDSRNDGYDFKNKEEYVCRDDVLLSNGKISVFNEPVICKDTESCTNNAMLLFSVYGQGLGLGSISVIIDPLMNFTPSSLKMDSLLENYTAKLDDLDEDNLISTLDYIATTSPEIETLSEMIEYTIFRTPKLNSSTDRKACEYKCWAICPSFDLDQDAAEDIASLSDALADKVAPLDDFDSNAAAMYNLTMTRVNYALNTAIAENYTNQFKPLNSSGNKTMAAAKDILKHVLNSTLTLKLNQLQALHTSIPNSISQRNFSNLSSDFFNYQKLVIEVSNLTNISVDQYNKTLTAKNQENSLIMLLETKDLDPITVSSLEVLKAQTTDLNTQFRDGLTLDELAALESNYTKITESAQDLLRSEGESPTKKATSMFRGLARRVNVGIAALADSTNFMPRSEIPSNQMVLAGFSLVIFLSFASLIVLVFLYLFALNNFKVPKTPQIMAVAMFSILIILFMFSAFLFIFLDKTATSATLTEFVADFGPKQSTAILVDLRNTTLSDAQAMQDCANKFADLLSDQNKTWTIYSVSSTFCTVYYHSGTNSSSTPTACESNASISDSSFVLGYSDIIDTNFSIIYENKAEISADGDYYESCPLVAMFG
ncbi:MAG: hypothetical protein ABH842_01535 [Candidatus Micrarchaeota archaeon]